MANEENSSGTNSERFPVGAEDVVILPMAAIALVVEYLARSVWTALKQILDFLFPILLQLMRFPLFTLRILGDGTAALLKVSRESCQLVVSGVQRGASSSASIGHGCARRSVTKRSKKRSITSLKVEWPGYLGSVGLLRQAPR